MLLDAAEGGRTKRIIELLDAGVNIDTTDKVRLFIQLHCTLNVVMSDNLGVPKVQGSKYSQHQLW